MQKLLKRSALFLAALMLLPTYLPAQQKGKPEQTPRQRIRIVRKTILAFKDQLKLTPRQVKKIKKLLDDMNKKNKEITKEIAKLNKELNELFKKNGDLGEIKRKIKKIYSLLADLRINDIETGRKIDKILTPSQRKKWKEIRIQSLKTIQKLRQGGRAGR